MRPLRLDLKGQRRQSLLLVVLLLPGNLQQTKKLFASIRDQSALNLSSTFLLLSLACLVIRLPLVNPESVDAGLPHFTLM